MSEENHGTFQVKSWDEKPTMVFGHGVKFSSVAVSQIYSGVIEGEGTVEYVMLHHGADSPVFVGFERIVGKVAGKSGSFVIRHSGAFRHGLAKSDWVVVAGSGTDGLSGLGGSGHFTAGHGGQGAVLFHPVFAVRP